MLVRVQFSCWQCLSKDVVLVAQYSTEILSGRAKTTQNPCVLYCATLEAKGFLEGCQKGAIFIVRCLMYTSYQHQRTCSTMNLKHGK